MESAIKSIVCLTPVYNDWESFAILIARLGDEFRSQLPEYHLKVVAVDDGSTFEAPDFSTAGISIEIVMLKVNVGHQRAIAIGLQYIHNTYDTYDYLVVMDSDGEDRPEDVHQLVRKCQASGDAKIVFAQRKKRQESVMFKTGYFFYRYIFFWLTGQKINFGNFSCIPRMLMGRVAVQEHIWNHYSGSIIQSRTPYDRVLLDRGRRYAGVSKMNFTSLVLHGLSSIAVYFDFLSVRILKLSLIGVGLCFLSMLGVVYIKVFTELSIPGWASNLILIIFSIILQLSSVTLIVLLMQLSARKNVKGPQPYLFKEFIKDTNR